MPESTHCVAMPNTCPYTSVLRRAGVWRCGSLRLYISARATLGSVM